MGGNALKHLGVERISSEEFVERVEQFDKIMAEIHSRTGLEFFYDFPTLLPGKIDYGDLDVIYYAKDPDALCTELATAFGSRGAKKNGGVRSIEWNNFQVDMIYTPLESYDWYLNWYSHGDASAVKGRVYRYYKFKFGHDGLYYNVRTKNMSKDILVTRDWVKANNMLGYKPLALDVVYTIEDIYEYVYSSVYCSKKIFQKLKPDRQRSMQTDFYTWVETQPDKSEDFDEHYGMKLLWVFDRKAFWTVWWTKTKLNWKETTNPYRKKVRKLLWTKVYPLAFKLRGWL